MSPVFTRKLGNQDIILELLESVLEIVGRGDIDAGIGGGVNAIEELLDGGLDVFFVLSANQAGESI